MTDRFFMYSRSERLLHHSFFEQNLVEGNVKELHCTMFYYMFRILNVK